MPNSPVSGQHCRYSVFEVNAKERIEVPSLEICWFEGQGAEKGTKFHKNKTWAGGGILWFLLSKT